MDVHEHLRQLVAPANMQAWARQFKTAEEVWRACEVPEYLLWWVAKLKGWHMVRLCIVRAWLRFCRFDLAVRLKPLPSFKEQADQLEYLRGDESWTHNLTILESIKYTQFDSLLLELREQVRAIRLAAELDARGKGDGIVARAVLRFMTLLRCSWFEFSEQSKESKRQMADIRELYVCPWTEKLGRT